MKVKKLNIIIIFVALIGIMGYVGMTEASNLKMLFSQVNFIWMIGIVFLMVAYWGLEILTLHNITKKFYPRQKFKSSLQTTMIGQFFNCITPFSSGGQPMQVFHMVKTGVPFGIASSCLLNKFIIYQVVLTLYSLVVLGMKLGEFSSRINGFVYMVLIGFLINTAVVIALLSIMFFKRFTVSIVFATIDLLVKVKWIKEGLQKKKYVLHEVENFYTSFQYIKKHKKIVLSIALLSTLQLTIYFLVPYFILRAFGLEASIFSMIAAQAFVLMISSFIPLPGAAGGAELSFVAFFKLFFPANLLNISVLVWRLATFYLTICVGMCFTLWKQDSIQQEA